MKISIIGLGYVGLPTAVVLADAGYEVCGIDKNQHIVNTLNKGLVHFVEKDLEKRVKRLVKSHKLRASSDCSEADVHIIAVPTPVTKNSAPDLSFVKNAIYQICKVLKKGDLIILESTSPIGTTERILEWIASKRSDIKLPSFQSNTKADINVAYCPERVLPGDLINELINNDRIIGGITNACAKKALKIYQSFSKGQCHLTSSRIAEFCKLAENSYRDVNIAFANELSLISHKFDVNVTELIALANHHPRVNILQPGPGVGGHCIAIDPLFLAHAAKKESKLIQSARYVNNQKPKFILGLIKDFILKEKSRKNFKIAIFGLSYKADIDDLRESPALFIARSLTRMKVGKLLFIEPHINLLPQGLKGKHFQSCNKKEILNSDLFIFLVKHSAFKKYYFQNIPSKKILDFCGAFD